MADHSSGDLVELEFAVFEHQMGPIPTGSDEPVVHRSHRGRELPLDGGGGAAPLGGVSMEPTREPDVLGALPVDSQGQPIDDLGEREQQDALDQHDRMGIEQLVPVGDPGMGGEVVDRQPYRSTVGQGIEVPDEEFAVKGVGMVEVQLRPLLEPEVWLIAVVGVERENGDPVRPQLTLHLVGKGGLSRAAPSADPDQDTHREMILPRSDRPGSERGLVEGRLPIPGKWGCMTMHSYV